MEVRGTIKYHWNEKTSTKLIDPDRYGILDMVCDIYNTVLDHIPLGRTVNFKMKCFPPNGTKPIEVISDNSIMDIITQHQQVDVIDIYVIDLSVSDESSTMYSIYGFPHTLVPREIPIPIRVETPMMTASSARPSRSSRPAKQSVRRGSAISSSVTNAIGRATTSRNRALGSPTSKASGIAKGMAHSKPSGRDSGPRYKQDDNARSVTKAVVSAGGRGTTHSVVKISCKSTSKSGKPPWPVKKPTNIDDIADDDTTHLSDLGLDDLDDADDVDYECEDDIGSSDSETSSRDKSDDDESEMNQDGGDMNEEMVEDDEDVTKFGEDYEDAREQQFGEGSVYSDVTEFRAALRDQAIRGGFAILFEKNESKRVTAVCAFKRCKWRVHASLCGGDDTTFMIKTLKNRHSCRREPKNKQATAQWIADTLATQLRVDPDMKVTAMKKYLLHHHGLSVHYMKCYRARLIAKGENEGSHARSYAKLPAYGEVLLERNPRSLYKLQFHERNDMEENPAFKRLFVCFEACKTGFLKGCRPFIGLDGCHLKGTYGGVLLSAISLDGNNGLFPVAFGVVEIECKDSWLFFLDCLHIALGLDSQDTVLTFMSDKQKGLSEAISETFPGAQHRNCSRHLYANFIKVFGGGKLLRAHFWSASTASNACLFNRAMEKLKRVKPEAHEWLVRIHPGLWSRHAYDFRAKSDHNTNNACESFNQWITDLRSKPILTLVDQIRVKLMERLRERYEASNAFEGKITPNIKRKLNLISADSRYCHPFSAGDGQFEVVDGLTRFVVDIRQRTCGCTVWEATGLPCKHAASAIKYQRGSLEDYCDPFYTVDRFRLAYGGMIHPLPDLEELIDGVVQHPPLKRLQGRPKKNRRREENEPGPAEFRKRSASVRCDICKAVGHNRRTCHKGPMKGKETSSSQTARKKRKASNEHEAEPSTTKRFTRSQASQASQPSQASSEVVDDSVQAKRRARMAAKAAKIKKKRAAAHG